MPGDEKEQGSARRLRQGTIVPNEERSAPRRINRIQLADPLWAKFAAGILIVTLPATSAGVASNDAFLNSTNRINNGETMPSTQIEAPQGLRASADDISRLSSDANVSRILQSGNQNFLLQRVNDILAALDGTGQPFRREMLLGSVTDQQSWADKYSSLTEAQKRAFIDQAIIVLAENFGDQFTAGGAVRINEAFGSVVQQNLESMFTQAAAAQGQEPAQRSWLASIPIIGRFFGGTPEEVVPVTTEPSLTLTASDGTATTITSSDAEGILSDLGISGDMIGQFSRPFTFEETIAMLYANAFADKMQELYSSGATSITQEQVAQVQERALFSVMAFASANMQAELQARNIDTTQMQQASLKGWFLDLIAVGGYALASYLGELRQITIRTGAAELNTALQAARERINTEIVTPAETAVNDAKTRIANAEQALKDIRGGYLTARQQQLGTAEQWTQQAQAELDAANAALPIAKQALQTARAQANMRMGTLAQNLEAVRTGGIAALGAESAPGAGESAISAVLRASGFNEPNLVLEGRKVAAIDSLLSSNPTNAGLRVNVEYSPSQGTATARLLGEFEASNNPFARVFVDPVRFATEPGVGLGYRAMRLATIPFRVAEGSIAELAGKGQKPGLDRGMGITAGALGLLGCVALDWELNYIAGGTDYGPFWLWQRTPAQRSTATSRTTAAPAQQQETREQRAARETAQNFRGIAERLEGSNSTLLTQISLYETSVLGIPTTASDLTPYLDRLYQNRGAIQSAAQFLSGFETSARGKTPDEAAALFYKQFFTTVGAQNLVKIIEAYVPEAERLDMYSYLYSQVALKSPTRPVLDEATLFDKLRTQARFTELVGPLMDVVEANLNWEGARSRRAGAAGPAAYFTALVATVDARDRMGGSPNPQTVAVTIAEQNLSRFSTTLSTIKASIENEADRLDAYVNILKFLAAPENANITDANLERQFLLQQLDKYPDLRSAVETFFYNDATMLRKASIYIMQLTRDAALEPGVSARGPTEVDAENLLRRRLSQNPSVDIRNLLDAVYLAQASARGRPQFDANKFTMLVDAAVFLEANPGATADQLKQHFIDEFNARYPGLDLSTVQSDKQFDLVAALLPLRDSRGDTLSPDAMLERANGTEYWSFRTTEWLRTNFVALPAAERASSFISLPEALQTEYWNAHADEREDLYNAAKRDRVWNAAHGTDLRGHSRRRGRTTVTTYPVWE